MNNFNNFAFLMRAKTVEDAKQYPLAPNSTVIFIGENNAFCCLKYLGSSPFDTPVFIDFYRKQMQETKQEEKQIEYATKQELNSYIEQFNIIGNNFGILRKELENIKNELGIKENKNAE